MFLFFALMLGLIIPIQTAVNSRLRSYVLSPYVASLVSFLVGTTFLFIILLITKGTVFFPISTLTTAPPWVWIGGVLGVIGLTTNILLFPKLGGVQTVMLPMMGQIIASLIIDTFGFFHAMSHPLSILRIIGVVLLACGIYAVIVLPNKGSSVKNNVLPFQLLGILGGMMMATQSAINAHLGHILHSAIHAAFISFTVGSILLFIVVLFTKSLNNFKIIFQSKLPPWIFTGGLIGALFVFGVSFLVPHIGTGMVVMIGLFGQILCSLMIDRFGWFGAYQRLLTPVQYVGLLLMILGVVFVKIF